MTTIAYRDGVLAGESLVTENGIRVGTFTKVAKAGSVLAGGSGSIPNVQAFLGWFRGGMRGECPPMGEKAEGMIVWDGWVLTFTKDGVDAMRAPFHAIGSGCQLAHGAMLHGASAEEAVLAACEGDVYSGGRIVTVRC